jgi:TRAP transporter TAXI family solute receptor
MTKKLTKSVGAAAGNQAQRQGSWVVLMREYRAALVLGALGAIALIAAAGFLLVPILHPIRVLRVGAGQAGGAYLPVARVLAEAFELHVPDLRVEVIETKGSANNVELLEAGGLDLALIQNDAQASARVRTVIPLYEEHFHVVARGDLAAKATGDLAGRRIAIGQLGSGTHRIALEFLPTLGLPEGAYEPVLMGPAAAVEALRGNGPEGADAFVAVLGVPSRAVQTALRRDRALLLPVAEPGVDGNVVEGFRLTHPWTRPSVIPPGAYGAGIEGAEPQAPIGTLSVLSILACSDSLEPALVESLAKAAYDHRSELVRKQPLLASFGEQFDRDRLQFPLHAGARRWFDRERPSFIVAYSETMGFLLSALLALFAFLSGAARWLAQRQKNRIDEHYRRLHDVLDDLAQLEQRLRVRDGEEPVAPEGFAEVAAELLEMETRAREIGRVAFRELVDERLAANESFVIFQNLLAETQREIRHQLAEHRRMLHNGVALRPR